MSADGWTVLMVLRFKYWVAVLLHRLGVLSWLRRRFSGRLLILCYHRVFAEPRAMADYFFPGMAVSEKMFAQQMQCLVRHYHVLSLREAVDRLKTGKPLPGGSVVITFDDGYLDNYRCAYPWLRQYNLPATFFLVTDFVGGVSLLWFDKMAYILRDAYRRPELATRLREHLPADLAARALAVLSAEKPDLRERIRTVVGWMKAVPGVSVARLVAALEQTFPEALAAAAPVDRGMTWEMVLDMQRHGMEIGSHTHTHPILTALPPERLAGELGESKRRLEERLGEPVHWFCYPNGDYDGTIQQTLREFGFRAACSLEPGGNDSVNDLMALRRININELYSQDPSGGFSESLFMAELAGVFDRLLLRRFRKA